MMLDHVVVSGPDLRRYSHGQQYTIIHTWRCCVSGGRGVGLECIDVVCQNIDDVSAYGVSRRAENVGDNRTLSYCVYIHCTTVAPIGPILFNVRKLCPCTCTTHFSRTLHIAHCTKLHDFAHKLSKIFRTPSVGGDDGSMHPCLQGQSSQLAFFSGCGSIRKCYEEATILLRVSYSVA